MIEQLQRFEGRPENWFRATEKPVWGRLLADPSVTLIQHESGSLALFQAILDHVGEGHIWVPEDQRSHSIRIGLEMLAWADENLPYSALMAKTRVGHRHTKLFLRRIGFKFYQDSAEVMGSPYSYFMRHRPPA